MIRKCFQKLESTSKENEYVQPKTNLRIEKIQDDYKSKREEFNYHLESSGLHGKVKCKLTVFHLRRSARV